MKSPKLYYNLLAAISVSFGWLPDSRADERSRGFERDFKAAVSVRAKALTSKGAKIVRLTSKKKAVYFAGLSSNQKTATEASSKSLPIRFKTLDLESRQLPRSGNS